MQVIKCTPWSTRLPPPQNHQKDEDLSWRWRVRWVQPQPQPANSDPHCLTPTLTLEKEKRKRAVTKRFRPVAPRPTAACLEAPPKTQE